MMQLRKGDRWGKLTLVDIFTEVVKTTHNGVTDSIPTVFLDLRCECGKSKVVSKGSFPGRRQMRDCGCGAGEISQGRITAAYFPATTYNRVDRYAKEQGLTVSKAIAQLCLAGLAASQTVATVTTPTPTHSLTASVAASQVPSQVPSQTSPKLSPRVRPAITRKESAA